MRILALEPYYGGSHKAFLDGWVRRSRHAWTVLELPAHKWKWRMRHAAVTFAERVDQALAAGASYDLLFCSDMLNLAEFLGLAPPAVRSLPSVAYFHENQLTYPVRCERERDYHFVLTNLTTALAATRVWFNSAYHRDAFLGALPKFLKRMPDHQPMHAIELIRAKSSIHSPGVDEFPPRGARQPGPLRILWAARWEHDKNPDLFFEALERLELDGVDFRISVLGERFRDAPPVFERARARFAARIDRWGYQESRGEYEAALREADVIVSTADHEFFGLSVVEAVAAGALPLLPRRLAYPEILRTPAEGFRGENDDFFYDGGAQALADRLAQLAERLERGELRSGASDRGARAVSRYAWSARAPAMDDALEAIAPAS